MRYTGGIPLSPRELLSGSVRPLPTNEPDSGKSGTCRAKETVRPAFWDNKRAPTNVHQAKKHRASTASSLTCWTTWPKNQAIPNLPKNCCTQKPIISISSNRKKKETQHSTSSSANTGKKRIRQSQRMLSKPDRDCSQSQ